MGLLWTCMGLQWTCNCVGLAMDLLWICNCVIGVQWSCSGFAKDLYGFALDLLLICMINIAFVVDLLLICIIYSHPTPPCI